MKKIRFEKPPPRISLLQSYSVIPFHGFLTLSSIINQLSTSYSTIFSEKCIEFIWEKETLFDSNRNKNSCKLNAFTNVTDFMNMYKVIISE